MRRMSNDKIINEAFDLLLKGYTAKEIKKEMFLSDEQWTALCSNVRFMTLLHTHRNVSNEVLIRDIENDLFNLLALPKRDHLVNKRISALQNRYATFLLC